MVGITTVVITAVRVAGADVPTPSSASIQAGDVTGPRTAGTPSMAPHLAPVLHVRIRRKMSLMRLSVKPDVP